MNGSPLPNLAVSVVIPVLNGGDRLRHTIEALLACDIPDDLTLEIIVSDDGSAEVARSFGEVVLLVTGDHAGPAAARNRGVKAASGEVLAFVDCGDAPRANWLRVLAAPFRDRQVGITTAAAEVHDVEAETVVLVDPGRYRPSRIVALAGCFAIRREVCDAVDGYDPNLRFGENRDLCDRARLALDDLGLGIHRSDDVITEIELGEPSHTYDQRRLDAMEYVLERDHAQLLDNAPRRARLHGLAAVNAGRCGDWPRARRHAWGSIRAEPRYARSYVRGLMTLCPPLARWRWLSPGFRRRISADD